MVYYIVGLTILALNNPGDVLRLAELRLAPSPAMGSETLDDHLEVFALEMLGIVFTSYNPAVLVNSFGPIHYCQSHQEFSLSICRC